MNIIKKLTLIASLTSTLTSTFISSHYLSANQINRSTAIQMKNVAAIATQKNLLIQNKNMKLAVTIGIGLIYSAMLVWTASIVIGVFTTKSHPKLSKICLNIAEWPINTWRNIIYGKPITKKTEFKKALYNENEFLKNSDLSFETGLKNLAQDQSDFDFSEKTNKYNKKSFCFQRKNFKPNEEEDEIIKKYKQGEGDEDLRNKASQIKEKRVSTVSNAYKEIESQIEQGVSSDEFESITPDITLEVVKELFKNKDVCMIIINKSGLPYQKISQTKTSSTTQRPKEQDSESSFSSEKAFQKHCYPIKIKLINCLDLQKNC